MKILLFGGSGQLGHDLRLRAEALNFDMISPVSSEADITNFNQVNFLVKKVEPQLIINSAAYTRVDDAESNSDLAFAVNRDGAINIAKAAKEVNARLIHISTDYVYDGSLDHQIPESTLPNPINVYGASKLAGDYGVLDVLGAQALVLRTSWLHGSYGNNFVQTMIRLFREQSEIRVVNDQFGSPTWTGWLAEIILDLGRIKASGIMHAACKGRTSWYDFACKIYSLLLEDINTPFEGGIKIKPQSTEESARKAKRPKYSVLGCNQLVEILGREPISWEDGLMSHLKEIGFLRD